MEVTSSSATSSREIRKIRKPLMERKRRARINDSLDALQRLLSEAEGMKGLLQSRQSKLEKADILDLTVLHLQNLNRQQNLKQQSQCGCLIATSKINNQNNNVTTTTPHVINNQNNFEKYLKTSAETSSEFQKNNVVNYNCRSHNNSTDKSSFADVKSVENPQFSNSDRENSQLSNRCTTFVLENPQFSEQCVENFREIPVSLRENYENIDPSLYRVASYNNCSSSLSKTIGNCQKNSVSSDHNMVLVNSRGTSENLLKNSGFYDVSVNKNLNAVATSSNFLENSSFRDDLGVKAGHDSAKNELKILENYRTRDYLLEENSNLVLNRDSLSLVPVKLADGTLAFIVPKDVEQRFFERQNKVFVDVKTNREANSEGFSAVYNDVRNNNRVPQNCPSVWRPWF